LANLFVVVILFYTLGVPSRLRRVSTRVYGACQELRFQLG